MGIDNSIFFPAIGFRVDPSRIAFEVFDIPVYWYGILIAIGFLLGLIYALWRIKKEGMNEDDFLLMLIICLPVSIVCARAYYVIFNQSVFMRDGQFDWLAAISIRDGGMAIYGGLIGALLCALIICRIKNISFLKIADIVSVGFLIGQGIGRWGNFVNREAYGTITDAPWRMEIYDSVMRMRVAVHPTFLYESIWNLIGALLLSLYYKRRKFNGEVFLLYLAWYGLGRAFIEGLRTDSLYFFSTGIRISQVVAAASFIIAIIIIAVVRHKKKRRRWRF